ncbi:MAG: YjgB family protein [Gorillibacterium sp.]|nr:YjgB family protein [Gorillibacterium sp.]
MKRSIKRLMLGLSAVAIAISIGFISGYWVAPSKNTESATPSPTQGKPAEILQSNKNPGSAQPSKDGTKTGEVIDASTIYTLEHPSLMALTLSDTFDDVTKRYGKPDSQYVQNEEGDPLIIYHYAQFTVGFAENRQVRFVEISDNGSDPGLNGLRVGANQASAVQALGEPDTNTGYVLTYQTEDTILKIDIDPITDTIQSIKLFSRIDL